MVEDNYLELEEKNKITNIKLNGNQIKYIRDWRLHKDETGLELTLTLYISPNSKINIEN